MEKLTTAQMREDLVQFMFDMMVDDRDVVDQFVRDHFEGYSDKEIEEEHRDTLPNESDYAGFRVGHLTNLVVLFDSNDPANSIAAYNHEENILYRIASAGATDEDVIKITRFSDEVDPEYTRFIDFKMMNTLSEFCTPLPD